jgi:hypothetical protein
VFEISCDFIVEFASVNAFSTAASPCWVTTLDHEITNDAMEHCSVIVTCMGQSSHVVTCARRMTMVQFHYKCANARIELHVRVRILGRRHGEQRDVMEPQKNEGISDVLQHFHNAVKTREGTQNRMFF